MKNLIEDVVCAAFGARYVPTVIPLFLMFFLPSFRPSCRPYSIASFPPLLPFFFLQVRGTFFEDGGRGPKALVYGMTIAIRSMTIAVRRKLISINLSSANPRSIITFVLFHNFGTT